MNIPQLPKITSQMSSIGVFSEREIDGKPFLIFQSQTDTPTTSSSSFGVAAIDPSPQPLFLCINTRKRIEKLNREENGYELDYEDDLPYITDAHFFNTTDLDQIHSWDSRRCDLPLVSKDCEKGKTFMCSICYFTDDCSYYCCPNCSRESHKGCVEAPPFIKHPFYPFLSLQLYLCSRTKNHISCSPCGRAIFDTFYYCPTYNLRMHPFCAMKPIPIFIDHPKRHPHPLTFFPKQNSLVCNVCGVIKELIPTYVCARCVFVVHQDCVYFPYVIRISRHQHRISFTSSLPSGKWSCGVCRKEVDNDCGAYSCNKCDGYFVHSRCALREDLWDGVELEGVPEEPEIVVEPFQKIADGIILHFSHDHHLKLEISRVYDDDKFCQACVLPIYEGNFYSCMDQCDFILHEVCANSPLKNHHPLNARSLTLKVVTNDGHPKYKGYIHCYACRRTSCGFVYWDPEDRRRANLLPIDTRGFSLDLRCASVSEPFNYQGHEHPLYLALDPKEEEAASCQVCQEDGDDDNGCKKLNCIECDYVICFNCATLPYKAKYKHDKHVLTFQKGGEASDESGWCEVCESKILYSRKGGFYLCDDYCGTTLHIDCLLGKDPYMKPGQIITRAFDESHIVRNNTMSRPFCHQHDEDRCPYRVVFRESDNVYRQSEKTFCSYNCLTYDVKRQDWECVHVSDLLC